MSEICAIAGNVTLDNAKSSWAAISSHWFCTACRRLALDTFVLPVALKEVNGLKSNVIKVGQHLLIK